MNDEKNIIITLRAGIKYIVLSGIVFALVAFLLASFVIEKKYTAESVVCVNITDSYATDYDELSMSATFADSYIAYINHDFIRTEISKRFRNKYTAEQLASMIEVEKVDDSQMLRIRCTASSSEEAASICAVIPDVASQKIYEITGVGSALVLEKSYLSGTAVFPNVPLFTSVGAVLGIALAFAICYIKKIYFGKIEFCRELEIKYSFPILGDIPQKDI